MAERLGRFETTTSESCSQSNDIRGRVRDLRRVCYVRSGVLGQGYPSGDEVEKEEGIDVNIEKLISVPSVGLVIKIMKDMSRGDFALELDGGSG